MSVTSGPIAVEELGTILGVWAHPDDECYLMAGTAMLAAAAGAHVACVTATAGEAGETSDETRWPRHQLAAIRRSEMAASLEVLGIADHTWFDLPDGGLSTIEARHGVALVSAVVDRVQPDTILTFGPDGMTGHPDHITIGAWAGEAAVNVTGGRCRVLHATKTSGWVARFSHVNQRFDLAPPATDPAELALELTLVDASLDRKVQALSAQASQTLALSSAIGADTYRQWVADEFWTHAG
jgi:LmbE family N-acetylglucosaminyl deacetylase